jgi:c(7)-type cytochrome triheme protein
MVLWNRVRDRRSPGTEALLLLAVVLAAALNTNCRKAASVFLDLPPETPEPNEAVSTIPQAESVVAVGGESPQDRIGPRPAIESTLDREVALALLPRDSAGNVDWVAALRDGTIRPRGKRGAEQPATKGFGYDFFMKGSVDMFDAYFPHSTHVEWLGCTNCHPGVVPYRHEPITMESINQGESCGQCHGKVAFPVSTCGRCHLQMGISGQSEGADSLGDLVLRRRYEPAGDEPSAETGYPPARFPHWVHRIRYRCTACHTNPLEERFGATPMPMDEMGNGQTCADCHDGDTAFPLMECNRCHVPTPAARDSTP